MNTPRKLYEKRKARVRTALKAAANGKMRLSVFRSGKHIYAQIIDDTKGCTLVAASTVDPDVKSQIKKTDNVEAATVVGTVLAKRAVEKGIEKFSRIIMPGLILLILVIAHSGSKNLST